MMKKRKKKQSKTAHRYRTLSSSLETSLTFHEEFVEVKKQIKSLWAEFQKMDERIQDIEIHTNLLTRLLTTLCIEKFGMRVGVLKRLIKRIEKEAIRDSQILHLESLYKLPHHSEKKNPSSHSPQKDDPWEEIS